MPREWQGPDSLRSLLVPIGDLVEDIDNARAHTDRNITAIAASLLEFGQTKPVVVRDGVVYAGNGTLRAARVIGWAEIAVSVVDNLTPDQARAYSIADNQTTDLSRWDPAPLKDALAALPEKLLPAVGFTIQELKDIANLTFKGSAVAEPMKPDDGFRTLKLTGGQWETLKRATAKLQAAEGADEMAPSSCVEYLAAEYLS